MNAIAKAICKDTKLLRLYGAEVKETRPGFILFAILGKGTCLYYREFNRKAYRYSGNGPGYPTVAKFIHGEVVPYIKDPLAKLAVMAKLT